MIPDVKDQMENCPSSDVNVVYMTLSALIGLFMFLIYQVVKAAMAASHTKKTITKQKSLKDAEFRDLQLELFGADKIKDSLSSTNHSVGSSAGAASSSLPLSKSSGSLPVPTTSGSSTPVLTTSHVAIDIEEEVEA
jgi:hypothetical protein